LKILIIEDEEGLRESIEEYFTEAGNICETAASYTAALAKVELYRYDCILLDITLPGGNGIDILKTLKSNHYTDGVLIISAKNSLDDRLQGLDLGADDYLPKPFAMQELVARVRALGRRYAEEPALSLRVGDLTFDLANHEVFRGSDRIDLSTRELMLLKVLMREPGRIFTRTELCERVWEHEHEYDTKLVEVFIGRLRKKIGEPPLIHTVRHVGYAICEAIPLASAQEK